MITYKIEKIIHDGIPIGLQDCETIHKYTILWYPTGFPRSDIGRHPLSPPYSITLVIPYEASLYRKQ